MNDRLSKKSKSYRRIKKVLADNPTAVASTPILQAAGLTFQTKLDNVEGVQVPELGATVPGTDFKNDKFLEFGNELLPICNGLRLFANDTSDMVLAGKVPVVISNLMEGNEVTQVNRFWAIIDAAKAVTPAADLIPYGITAAILTDLETKLEALDALVDGPRSAIDGRIVKRELQVKAFKDMDKFLNETLDLAVRTRQTAFPEFVSAYFLARKQHQGGGTGEETEQEEENLVMEMQPKLAMPTTKELTSAMAPLNGQPALNGVH